MVNVDQRAGLNSTELILLRYTEHATLEACTSHCRRRTLTTITEEEYFSTQDAFLPAARLALKENLQKQAMKAWIRGKDCKVSSFVKGCVKTSSESSTLFWHPNVTSNLWLYASSALGVKLLAACLGFTAFWGLETESAEREGVQRPEYWDYFISLVCFSFLFTRNYWCL